jgi:predicted type IV restriction endonuclease
MAVPKKISDRFAKGLKKYRKILRDALDRDVNETDTVTVVNGILSDVLGWDRFRAITSEVSIRGTFVDIAIVDEGRTHYLVEVKAIGANLKDNHLRQAVGYGANHGVEWVVLTNGRVWQAHKIKFAKPISSELVFEVDLLNDSLRDEAYRQCLFTLTKEGMRKKEIASFYDQRQAMSRYNIAAILRSEGILKKVRLLLKRAYPSLKATTADICSVLENEVLKRDVREGKKAAAASRVMKRSAARYAKKRSTTPVLADET